MEWLPYQRLEQRSDEAEKWRSGASGWKYVVRRSVWGSVSVGGVWIQTSDGKAGSLLALYALMNVR